MGRAIWHSNHDSKDNFHQRRFQIRIGSTPRNRTRANSAEKKRNAPNTLTHPTAQTDRRQVQKERSLCVQLFWWQL